MPDSSWNPAESDPDAPLRAFIAAGKPAFMERDDEGDAKTPRAWACRILFGVADRGATDKASGPISATGIAAPRDWLVFGRDFW